MALSVAASDLDNDGWPDIYVANDSSTATLYQNQKDGTFKDIAIESGAALSPEGKPQAGMGVSIGDYNRDGNSRHREDELSPATRIRSTRISATARSKTALIQAGSASIRACSAGASVSSIWITTGGSTFSCRTVTFTQRWINQTPT